MAKIYLLDLKEKVMAYVKSGNKRVEAVKILNLHRRTIYRWEKKQREERLVATKDMIQESKKLNPEELKEHIKFHPDETLKEIGTAFGVNDASILYRIRQLMIAFKRSYYIRNETKTRGKYL